MTNRLNDVTKVQASLLVLLLGLAQPSPADTFRCVDAAGHGTYTNVEGGAKKQTCTLIQHETYMAPANTDRGLPASAPAAAPAAKKPALSIPLQKQGGAFIVPVLVNHAVTLNFIVDSGASDVSIPADVVTSLMQSGTLSPGDFLGEKTYTLADGSKMPSQTFRIRSMQVGDRIVENLTGGVAPLHASPLLGQSFLRRLKSWSIDNENQALLLE